MYLLGMEILNKNFLKLKFCFMDFKIMGCYGKFLLMNV